MRNLTYKESTPTSIKYKEQPVKEVKYKGITVWKQEQQLPALSASCINYYDYHTTIGGTSNDSIDASTFNTLTFQWSLSTKMHLPNAHGVSSTSTIYLRLGNGDLIQVAQKSGILYWKDTTYTDSAVAVIDISQYSETNKSDIKLYVTLSNMDRSEESPDPDGDRHDLTVTTGNIIAS